MDRLRIGIIGAGNIAHTHQQAWQKEDRRARIVGVVDINQNAAVKLANKYGGVPVFTDFRTMLQEQRLDAVDICLPYQLQANVTIEALNIGLHVMCEKPMCETWADALAVGRAAKDSNQVLMYAHCELFHPGISNLKKLTDSGIIGPILRVKARYCYRHDLNDQPLPENGSNPLGWRDSQGRDYGNHAIYPIHWLIPSAIKRVNGWMSNKALPFLNDDTLEVRFELENGVSGHVFTSYAFAMPGEPRMSVVGTHGRAWVFDRSDGTELHYQVYERGFGERISLIPYQSQSKYDTEVTHFIDCIEQKQEPVASLAQAMWALQLTQMAEQSAHHGSNTVTAESFDSELTFSGRV